MCLVQRNISRGMGAHEMLSIHCTDNAFCKFPCSFICFSALAGLQMSKIDPPSTGREVSEYLERNCRGLPLDCWDRGLEPR